MTPLERGARALAKHFPNPYPEGDFPNSNDVEMRAIVDAGHKAAVRAVLYAIREPSKRMIGEGRVILLEGERKTVEAYEAMIDAALEEG